MDALIGTSVKTHKKIAKTMLFILTLLIISIYFCWVSPMPQNLV